MSSFRRAHSSFPWDHTELKAYLESIPLAVGGHRTVSKYNKVWHNPKRTPECFHDRKVAE